MTTLDTMQALGYSGDGKTVDKVLTPEQVTAAINELTACCDHLCSIAQDQYHPSDPRIVEMTKNMERLFNLLQ